MESTIAYAVAVCLELLIEFRFTLRSERLVRASIGILAAGFMAIRLGQFFVAQWQMRESIRRATLCPTCSYDLRAHAPGQACPECGTPRPLPPAT